MFLPTTNERQVALIASSALGSSMLFLGAFFFFAYALAVAHPSHVVMAAALLLLYLVQIHYLSTVHRRPRSTRLRIWQWSLAAHLTVFVVAYFLTHDSVVLVFLIPEALSAVLHLLGIYLAARSTPSNEPSGSRLGA